MKKLLFIAILGIAASCTQNPTKSVVPANDSTSVDTNFVDISDSDSVCTDSLVEFAAQK